MSYLGKYENYNKVTFSNFLSLDWKDIFYPAPAQLERICDINHYYYGQGYTNKDWKCLWKTTFLHPCVGVWSKLNGISIEVIEGKVNDMKEMFVRVEDKQDLEV